MKKINAIKRTVGGENWNKFIYIMLQNRAARVLTFARYDAGAKCFFRQLEHSVSNTKSPNGLRVFIKMILFQDISSTFVKRYEMRYPQRDSGGQMSYQMVCN